MQMKMLWREFEKTLWKQRQIEEKNYAPTIRGFQGKTYHDEIHQWENYAMQNYKDASLSALNY